jgi:hypothetical protein
VLSVAGIYNEVSLEWKDGSAVLVPEHVDMSEYYVSSMWTDTNKEREFYMARFHRYKQSSKLNCYVSTRTPTTKFQDMMQVNCRGSKEFEIVTIRGRFGTV